MNYKHVELVDRGEVLLTRFKQASILDQAVIDQIGAELMQTALEASGNRKLLLDFQIVNFMSSAMIGKLLQLHKRCKADKIKLKMCSISNNLMEVFKITQLNKLFEIYADEAAGVAAFDKRGFFG